MKRRSTRLLSALLTGAMLLPLGLAGCGETQSVQVQKCPDAAVRQADYPEMAPYPDESEFFRSDGSFDDEGFSKVFDAWHDSRQALRSETDLSSLTPFLSKSIPAFLSGAGGENRVYSPLNVYMALAMLSELTDGETRQQVLDLLGVKDLAALRAQASALWNANYCDDGAVTSILASSLWLNDTLNFVPKTLDTLAETYHASTYQGVMGSDALNQALQNWLNEQTGGLLKDQAGEIELDSDTVLALATTLYYKARWGGEFSADNNKEEPFHAPGGDLTCTFMHQSGSNSYYWGEKFSAVPKSLTESGSMWLILPDEGVTPEALLQEQEFYDFLSAGHQWEQNKYLVVNLGLPKFDVSSSLDLRAGLKSLGIQDAFDPDVSDFTPIVRDIEGIYLSQAQHAARVMVDEEGCTAAAFTVMAAAGSAMPPDEEVDFQLDRPFLFVLTSRDEVPLFVGVVNTPVS